jgi:rifampicin phosphotransferase
MGEAIVRAFSSCLDARVVSYKRAHGFDVQKPSIAIVVQRQVACDAAGVGFSVNPINNSMDEVIVNCNYGLGETVVAGLASPDQFVLDKISRDIVSKQCGTKEVSIWLDKKNGGTTELPNSEQLRKECVFAPLSFLSSHAHRSVL